MNSLLVSVVTVVIFESSICLNQIAEVSSGSESKMSSLPITLNQKDQMLPHQKGSKKLPTILKIFENPSSEDGYESLRKFSDDLTKGMSKTQLYNTSIALTAALFGFQLPSNHNTEPTTISMANQVIFGLFAMLTGVLIFALPVLFTGQKFNPEARSNEDGIISRFLQTKPIARLIRNGDLKKIGLEPEKCVQKTICEAHRTPENKKYGMLALPFQIFYPPLPKDSDQSHATPFQEAAFIGKYTGARCGHKYNCFFDTLDLGRYLIDWYQYHHGGVNNDDNSNV